MVRAAQIRLPSHNDIVTLGFGPFLAHAVLLRALLMKLAYLLSEYPTLGHTYLLREVRQLRQIGWDIQTISIRRPSNRRSALSSVEAEELEFHLVYPRRRLVHVSEESCRHSRNSTRSLLPRVRRRLGASVGFNPRQTALAIAYFVEAVCAGQRLHESGITYVHSVYSTTVALILSRIFDVNLSMTFHGPAEFIDPEGFGIRDKVRAAQVVCAISYFGRSQIMLWSASSDWHKFEVTPLGIDLSGWEVATFRENPSPFELVSVGRLVEIKGYPLLLEAMAQSAQSRSRCAADLGG